MLALALSILILSLSSVCGDGLESIPFKFYEELGNGNVTSEQCGNDVKSLLEGLKNLDRWALEMVDSTAKIPSGILRGNLNQFGDFDECLGVNGNNLIGQYCLVAIQLKQSPFDNDIHAYHQVKNNLTDLGHRLPKFSTVYWGVCVPSSCKPRDVASAVEAVTFGVHDLEVLVENDMCRVKRVESKPSIHFDWVRSVMAFLIMISFMVGQGALTCSEEIDPDLERRAHFALRLARVVRNSFSPLKNLRALFTPPSKNSFKSLDGVRALNMIALLICHMFMAKMFLPYLNKTEMSKNMSKSWLIIGRVAYLYTDSFLIISGLLAANTLCRSSAVKSIISRYVRLTATLGIVMLICSKYLPDMNDGPMWNMVVTRHAELCYKNWWRNLLYIQNWFGFENMCLTHTHQLAIDFQLYLLAIPLVYLLRKSENVATAIIASCMALSTILRYQAAKTNNLATVVYFGSNVSQLNRTFDLTYTLPTHRATVYLMGLLVGYWMHQRGRLNLNKSQIRKAWLVAIACGMLAVFGPYQLADKDYMYNSTHLAMFNAAAPILWSVFVLWTVVATDNESAGWFGALLCWRPFVTLSKISYAVYLIQFPVFFYFVSSARGASLNNIGAMFDVGQMLLVGALSVVLTLAVDMPFQKIGKYVSDGQYEKIKLY